MTEDSDKKPEEAEDAAASESDAPEDEGSPEGDAPEAAEPDYKALAAELNDRMLRAVAELENYRKRADKERQDTAKFAISGFARDCLTVLDNLRRGLDSVSAEDRGTNPALEALAAGMELTERELMGTLERHGIVKVDPKGEPFDYDRHQAMFEVEDASVPAGTVVEVVQAGYLLHDRLLRAAMVGVSKGGPKPERVQAPIANEDLAQTAAPGGAGGPGAGADGEETPPEGDGEADTKA